MVRALLVNLLALLFSAFSLVQSCEDIQFDYEKHPYHPFDISHAELRLDINPDRKLLSGQVTYTIESKAVDLTVISMHAAELSITELLVDGEVSDFEVRGDTLDVLLADLLEAGEEIELTIQWQTQSDFGLHTDHLGNMWSSMNPLAHRHWMPGFDHPREQFTVDAYLSIPLEMEVMFNGNLQETLAISQEKKRVHWTTEHEISATGIGFVVGDFVISEMTAGFTKVRLFHPAGEDEQTRANTIIVEAARLKKEIENTLSFEYPHESLNMVVLPDNYWMERTHGTGTIYLFDRLGADDAQLTRNVTTQWFGEYLFDEQYLNLENEGVNGLLPTALHYRISDVQRSIENPDSLWTIQHWNRWQAAYPNEQTLFTNTIEESLPEMMRSFSGITSFDEIAEHWYQKTGISWFKPTVTTQSASSDSEELPSYALDILYDEFDSDLTLYFELQNGSGESLYATELVIYEFDKVTSQEITFTGDADTVNISIPATTEFISFNQTEFPLDSITIRQAPLYFLLNQLRSEDPENRKAAASLLKLHSDNPDLQLALSDILSFEENPEVIAAIYEALANLTDGATGTEEKFIRGLNNESESIQLASIRALSNYPGNDYVLSSLGTKMLRSSDEIYETSIEVYNQLAGKDDLLNTLSALQRRDTVGVRTLLLISKSDSLQQANEAKEVAEQYSEFEHPINIRKMALSYLDKFDTDADRWTDRLEDLLTDDDPRIRIWAVEKSPRFLSSANARELLESALINEMDPRVKAMIFGVLEEI
ncbi:MAG: hypothetical protein JJ895_15590 [Balneolaceae bacterium]|nr:hypothetical protein [Balneolaceae bacterium]